MTTVSMSPLCDVISPQKEGKFKLVFFHLPFLCCFKRLCNDYFTNCKTFYAEYFFISKAKASLAFKLLFWPFS